MLRHRQYVGLLIALLGTFAIAAGCGGARRCPACGPSLEVRSEGGPDFAITSVEQLQRVLQMSIDKSISSGQPLEVLALSGGGARGAWGAGVLKGWTDKPKFQVITGISTGAIIATFAFLGDDALPGLEDAYTNLRTEQVYEQRVLPLALLFSNSLNSTRPFKRTIRDYITTDMIDKVGIELTDNKRVLLVATVNSDTGELTIWPLTDIAAAKQYDLYYEVLRAATALPVVFPPVKLPGRGEGWPGKKPLALHIDGGVREQIFVDMTFVKGLNGRSKVASNVHAIVNGQLTVRQKCVRSNLLDIGKRTVNVVMAEGMLSALDRIYHSQVSGSTFLFSRIPEDYDLPDNSLEFDPEVMKPLFEAGNKWAMTGNWEEPPIPFKNVSPLPCELRTKE